MINNKRALGRGLSSLLGDYNLSSHSQNKVNILEITKIKPGKFQPRTSFSEKEIQELSDSIKENGIIQPIIVRESKEAEAIFYEIVAGERRLRASKLAGLETIPAIIRNIDDRHSLEIAIVENSQRQDLSPIEEANGYKKLIDEFSYNQEQVAKVVGKSRVHISNSLRFLSMPQEIQKMLDCGQITTGHAKVIVGVKNNVNIARKIVANSLSVRQTEELVKKIKLLEKKSESQGDDDSEKKISKKRLVGIEDIFQKKTGLTVNITYDEKRKKGRLVFNYNNLNELENMLNCLKIKKSNDQ